MLVPRSPLSAFPLALGLPITGGHTLAHLPEQFELVPVSASHRYTVMFLGPAARIVPSFLSCLVLIVIGLAVAAPGEAVEVALVLELGEPYGAAPAALVLAELELDLDELLPHPAASTATSSSGERVVIRRVIDPPGRFDPQDAAPPAILPQPRRRGLEVYRDRARLGHAGLVDLKR